MPPKRSPPESSPATERASHQHGSGERAQRTPWAAPLLRFLNQPASAAELVAALGLKKDAQPEFEQILAQREQMGGMLRSAADLAAVVPAARLAELLELARRREAQPATDVELERTQFQRLLLQNPNYFGNLPNSTFKVVKAISNNVAYEEIACLGLDPPYDRLEAVVRIKRNAGYGGDICAQGTYEFVRFYVDLQDNGVWHDVGLSSVRVHDIPGAKPLCYAVRRDFDALRRFCLFENIVRVRAILQWNAPPPPNAPDYVPVWGNVANAQVQIHPRPFFPLGELVGELEKAKVPIPDPIGPETRTSPSRATKTRRRSRSISGSRPRLSSGRGFSSG